MLAESLSLQSETAMLLSTTLFVGERNVDFFADRIRRHEAGAARLRAQLDNYDAPILPEDAMMPGQPSPFATRPGIQAALSH
jgi:hypothetical protein